MSFWQKNKLKILLLLIVPTLTGLLLGIEMNNNVIDKVPTVIIDQDQSAFSQRLTDYIKEHDCFAVLAVSDDPACAEQMLYNNQALLAVYFPQGLYADLREGHTPRVLVSYDASRLHMLAFCKSELTRLLLTTQAGYLREVFEGKLNMPQSLATEHLLPLDVSYNPCYNTSRNMRNYLLPGVMIALLQVAIAFIGTEAGRISRQTGAFSQGRACRVIGGGSLWGLASLILCIGLQVLLFNLPFKGSIAGFLLLSLIFCAVHVSFGYLVGCLIDNKTFAVQITGVCILPSSLLAGYTFPILAMPAPVAALAQIFPYAYYGSAVRDLAMKPLPFAALSKNLLILTGFFIIINCLLTWLLHSLRHKKGGIADGN